MAQPDERAATRIPALKQRKVKWAIAALLVLLLFVSLLPVGVRYGAIQALKQQGMQQVDINDIDINLFSGELGITGMAVSGDGQGLAQLDSLYINLSMLALFKQRLQIENIRLDGLVLDVKNTPEGEWIVAGYRPPPAEPTGNEATAGSSWGIGIDSLQLKAIKTQLDLPQLQTTLTLDDLQIKQLASWQPQQAASVDLKLRIDDAPLTINGQLHAFLAEPKLKASLTLNDLPLALANGFAAEADVKELTGALTINTNVSAILKADQPHVAATTTLALTKLSLQQAQYQISAKQFHWQGDVAYVSPVSPNDLGVRASGEVGVENFQLFDNDASLALVLLKQLTIKDIRLIEEQQATVAAILLDQMQLLSKAKDDELLNIASTTLEEIDYDGRTTLAIDQVAIQGLVASVQIQESGQLHLIEAVTKAQNTPAPTPAPEENESDEQAWRIKLAKLHIDKNARITFNDQSVKPPFQAEISPFELTVANIDTGAPEQAMDIALSSTINKHETLDVSASVKPFGKTLNATAEINISAVELPPLSPYVEQQLGYYLKRGQLDATINAVVTNNQLDTNVLAHLNKFNIEEGDPAKVESMTEKLDMPLDAALDLLRDKQDNIKLEITIDGNINDPQFDASKVINKAMANATKMAVTSYLKYMLQPWGALLTVADMVGKATETRFEPLSFTAGSAELSGDNKDYLSKIAALMQERPKLTLNICGRASQQDRNAIMQHSQTNIDEQQTADNRAAPQVTNEQLRQLATERTKRSKDWLVNTGVDSARLFTCYPDMEGVEKNAPIVDLSL